MATEATTTTSAKKTGARKRGGITQRRAGGGGTPNPAVAAVADKIGADTVDQVALDTAATTGAGAAAEADGLVPVTMVPPTEPAADLDPDPVAPAELSTATAQTIAPAAAPAPRMNREERREEKKRQKEANQTQSPSTKRLGPVGAKMPGAEHVKVHKRMPNGTLGYVGDYRAADIAQSQDMESFLASHALAIHGPGDYHLTGVDARGGVMDGGTITLLGPAEKPPTPEAPSVVQQLGELHDLHQRLTPPSDGMNSVLRDVLAHALKPAPVAPVVNPIAQMGQLMELQRSLKADAEGPKADNSGTTTAIIGAVTTIMTTMIPLLMQKKEMDPMMALLMTKMLDDSGGSSMPLPPPLAPPDPLAGIMPLITMMMENMKPSEGGGANEALITMLMSERMKPADMISMMTEMRGSGGSGRVSLCAGSSGDVSSTSRALASCVSLCDVASCEAVSSSAPPLSGGCCSVSSEAAASATASDRPSRSARR